MPTNPFACSECHLILADGIDQCSRCPSAPVSSDWTGYVVVMNPSRSDEWDTQITTKKDRR